MRRTIIVEHDITGNDRLEKRVAPKFSIVLVPLWCLQVGTKVDPVGYLQPVAFGVVLQPPLMNRRHGSSAPLLHGPAILNKLPLLSLSILKDGEMVVVGQVACGTLKFSAAAAHVQTSTHRMQILIGQQSINGLVLAD